MPIKSCARFLSLFAFCFLAGCAAQPAVGTTTAASPSLTPTLTPTKKHPLPTATLRATRIPIPTKDTRLTIKEPSPQELNDFLEENLDGYLGWRENTQFTSEDISGDGNPDLVNHWQYDNSIAAAIIFMDVNGDKQNDIVTYSYDELIVSIWDEDHYAKPLWTKQDWWGKGEVPANEITFQDWTNDGIPEIVQDYTFMTGGTAFFVYVTTRSIIHCDETECATVWEELLTYHADDYNIGGVEHYELNMHPGASEDGKPIIRTVDEGFSIFCCIDSNSFENQTGLTILPSTLSIYTWSGDKFELTDEQKISLGSHTDAKSKLAATSKTGINAKVVAKNNNYADSNNDYCQLIINGENVGDRFGCKQNFTIIEWNDITGDGLEEVVIISYSAGHPYDIEGNTLSDEECMHQRLIAYQSDGTTNTEIANVAGCVIRKDLYGVRLEDYDGDGIPEIFSAPNFLDSNKDRIPDISYNPSIQFGPSVQLNNRAYKWNGKKFVYLSDFPLEK